MTHPYHSLLPVSTQSALMAASAQCAMVREDPRSHAIAVQSIDSVAAIARADHPEKFWKSTDPAYQAMTEKWAARRERLATERVM